MDILSEAHQEVPDWLEGLARETRKTRFPNDPTVVVDGNEPFFSLSLLSLISVADRVVSVLEITVILLNCATTVVAVEIDQVAPLVALTIINNNGMVPMAVVCGAVIIKAAAAAAVVVVVVVVVATIVSHNNSRLVAVMATVNRTKAGGTARHE